MTTDTQISLPRLNEPAPDFNAPPRTARNRSAIIAASGWCCSRIRPISHPSARRNSSAFAGRAKDFAAIDCELLGLSIDSHYAHIAWTRNIKDNFGVDIPFPIIADLSMQVAHAYGMIQPGASDTAAVRATFVIDPEGVLRAMLYYPMTNGRSVDEIYRLVQSLQTSTAHGVATPEAWQPGDKVIVPPPGTCDAAEARASEGYETTDWYFSTRDL